MEFRIYYESLEQAEYYIKPILEKTFTDNNSHDYTIILIEKVQQSYNTKHKTLSKKYAKKISEILIAKNPDVIISCIKNGIEVPLIILEFSTAVFTKDHELQRTDNFNVALLSGAVYVKISPTDKDSGSHGGDTNYQYIEPYLLFYKKYNELSFHINWDVNPNNEAFVEKHRLYKSIPSKTSKIQELFKIIISTLKQNINNDNWKQGFNEKVKNNEVFKEWVDALENLEEYEDITQLNTSRLQWQDNVPLLNRTNVFTIKLNRLGHAMDPERGMLNYYGTFFRNENNTFIAKLLFDPTNQSWYKDTPKEKEIKRMVSNGFQSKLELVKAMSLGLCLPDYDSLKTIIQASTETLIDISKYVRENILIFNTAFRNIIKNSDILYISDNGNKEIYMTWTSDCCVENSHKECPDTTQISPRTKLTEDDVTYITIHHFFKENNIDTLAVSYPGAQSDMPILPQPSEGRKQKRVYIDTIGIKDRSLLFQENKGLYSKAKLNTDIKKIIKFKTDRDYITAVVEFKRKNALNADILYIGIGFGETKKDITAINSELELDDIDYFLVIGKDMTSWKVYSSINNDHNIFPVKKGSINKIKTFKVDS